MKKKKKTYTLFVSCIEMMPWCIICNKSRLAHYIFNNVLWAGQGTFWLTKKGNAYELFGYLKYKIRDPYITLKFTILTEFNINS